MNLSEEFQRARDALYRWEDYSGAGETFYVKNLVMVSRGASEEIATCLLIPAASDSHAAYVFVRESWANMYPAHHVSCAVMPLDGVWSDDMHRKNLDRLASYYDEASRDGDGRYMVAMYQQISRYCDILKVPPEIMWDQKYDAVSSAANEALLKQ